MGNILQSIVALVSLRGPSAASDVNQPSVRAKTQKSTSRRRRGEDFGNSLKCRRRECGRETFVDNSLYDQRINSSISETAILQKISQYVQSKQLRPALEAGLNLEMIRVQPCNVVCKLSWKLICEPYCAISFFEVSIQCFAKEFRRCCDQLSVHWSWCSAVADENLYDFRSEPIFMVRPVLYSMVD